MVSDTWKPGHGFWIYFDTAQDLAISGSPSPASQQFEISLTPGWNIIGNPFLFKVSVKNGLLADGEPIATSPAVRPGVFKYNPAEGYEAAQAIEPWGGYLVFARRAAKLIVLPVEAQREPGPTSAVRIVDATGKTVENLDLQSGAPITLKAAGYDDAGLFTGYVPVNWSVSGSLPSISSSATDTVTISFDSPGASGKITISAGHLSDQSGTIVVLGTGNVFEYPFNADVKITTDPLSGIVSIDGQAIVQFDLGTLYDTAKKFIEDAGGTVIGYNSNTGMFEVKTPAGTDPSGFGDLLNQAGALLNAVAPNIILGTKAFPSDPAFSSGLSRWGFEKIKLNETWGVINPIGSPVVAIVDTGIDVNHTEFAGKIEKGRNFIDPSAPDDLSDPGGHGTAVAGVIAANADNGSGGGRLPDM
ncbi:MAG TPA: S8 family serine peptidase [bacterium]|nr:S8 family serine peptidase [bacterium]